MKRIITVVLVALFSLTAFAQKTGTPTNLQPIYGSSSLNVVLDFSSARIMGYTEDEYNSANSDWLEDRQEIYDDFVEELNDRLERRKDGLTCGNFKSAPYSVVVIPSSVSAKGNVTAVIQYVKDGQVIYSYDAFGKGGKVGTFTNLVGDGMESLAKIITKDLKKYAVLKK